MSFKLRKIIIIPSLCDALDDNGTLAISYFYVGMQSAGGMGSVESCVMIAVSGFGHKGNGIVQNSKTAFVLPSFSAHIVEQSPPT